MPLIFTDAFYSSYINYMNHLVGKKYECQFGALTVNKQGRAMTYDSYYQKIQKKLSRKK